MVEQFRMSLRGPVAAAAPGRRWARRRQGTRAPGGRSVPWAPWQLRAARYTTFPEVTRKGPPRDLRGADNPALGFVSWILRTQKGLSSQSRGSSGSRVAAGGRESCLQTEYAEGRARRCLPAPFPTLRDSKNVGFAFNEVDNGWNAESLEHERVCLGGGAESTYRQGNSITPA